MAQHLFSVYLNNPVSCIVDFLQAYFSTYSRVLILKELHTVINTQLYVLKLVDLIVKERFISACSELAIYLLERGPKNLSSMGSAVCDCIQATVKSQKPDHRPAQMC